MATDLDFVEFITDQMASAGVVTFRKMFGEYGIYCNGKIMALACENQLYIKPTNAGKAYIEDLIEAPPYPGAKPYFLIDERLEDRDWLVKLVEITVNELPEPKPKKTKVKK